MHSVFAPTTIESDPSPQTLAATLRSACHERELEAGQTLYLYGDPATALYRVDHGMMRIVRMTAEGGVVTVRHVLPGDVFAEEALLRVPHATTAEALIDSRLSAFDPAYLDGSDSAILVRSLATQAHRLMDYGYHLQAGNLHQRVARYLVWLADTPLAVVGDDGGVSVGVTHELLAEGTGSTRESVSKIVTELRSEGLVASGYRSIQIVDVEGLALVAEGL